MKNRFPKRWSVKCLLLVPLAFAGVGDLPELQARTPLVSVKPLEWQITGRVVSRNGEPLPGVTVLVKGTQTGMATGIDGTYSLAVPEQPGTLIFSYVGFVTQERPFTGPGTINVTMVADQQSLDEVVVVGYGTQKRGDITSAVASMNTEQLTERPLPRVDQALVGQMAGVRVQQSSGLPGQGFRIQVRGVGSIGAGTEPLYVIDGFPLDMTNQNSGGRFAGGSPLDNINPNDIESIQVLKDAAAAAIYGSRASNGVVIITTKRGKEGKARINFNVSSGWSETVKKLDVLNAAEWIDRATEMINAAWVNSGPNRTAAQTPAQRQAVLGRFDRNLIPDERWFQPGYGDLMEVDWQDQIFRRGLFQNYQLSASGGTEAVKYFVSGDYLDQQGIARGVDYKRYSARANVEVQTTPKLRFGLNLNPSYSIANDPGVEGKDQIMHTAVTMVPLTEESVGLDVNVGPNPPYIWGNSRNSPIRVIENTIGKTENFRTLATIFGEYEILTGLRLRSTLNFDNTDSNYKYFQPGFVRGNVGGRQSFGRFSGYRRQTFVNENTLTYEFNVGENHSFTALGGYSYNFFRFNPFQLQSTGGFRNDDITTLNAAANISGTGSNYTTEQQNVLLSYFGRIDYNFLGRYLVQATLRRDGSSRFGTNTKWGAFPSASLGWRISEENFMQGVGAVNDLKLRASWGIAGNNTLGGDYEHLALLNFSNYSFNNNQAVGQVPANLNNPNLSWEEAETINLGFDLGLWENRVTSSFDIYSQKNRNLLLRIPVPTASGFGNALTNIGEVLNQGWEVELTTRNLVGAFEWTTNLNFSHNRNEVVQLGPNNTPILGGAEDIPHNILMVGQPMYSLYVVQQDGILTQEDLDRGAALYGNQTVGDPRYVDADDDGVISPGDRVLSGHPNPDYVWGVNNTFRYKGFDLNVLFNGQWGGKIYSLFGRAMDRTGQGFIDNPLGFHRDRWRSPEDPGAGIRGKAYSTFGRIKNTDWLYPNDYWRVRNITLGYDLGRVVPANVATGARIYVTAENFFGRDKYVGGFNPEAVNYNGDDYGAFPLSRSLIFGLNLTF